MPLIGPTLSTLMEKEVGDRMEGISGTSPLSQDNPAFFKQMMLALGTGTVLETTGKLQFLPTPPPPPVPTPPFAAPGLKFDADYFSEQLYKKLRTASLAISGKTAHDPFPPGAGNSGEMLLAMTEGLGAAIKKHYSSAALLSSPQTATAPAPVSAFTGIVPPVLVGTISGLAPTLAGPFFPQFVLMYAAVYAITIHTKTESSAPGAWTISGSVT